MSNSIQEGANIFMNAETIRREEVAQQAGKLMGQGYHCSEAILLAVGEHKLGSVDDQALRLSTPFAGGIGCSLQETCGGLSGGALLIGALYGRTKPDENDDYCQKLTARYVEEFCRELGAIRCADLRESGFGEDGKWPCSVLVERAARILFDILADEN
jgi:C_GCAxxG_C_C family probable redox protein